MYIVVTEKEVFMEHDCMDYRQRSIMNEGDDVLFERCTLCGKYRYEKLTDRPMAWFVDHTNPCGYRYMYDPHGNGDDLDAPSPWRYPSEIPAVDFSTYGLQRTNQTET